jgi:uncharacterized membrane protein YccC
MIKLKETTRQLLAGISASGVFALVYILFALKWLPALGIAFAVYIAIMLLIERAPEDSEVYIYENLTQHDLDKAVATCRQAAKKLQQVSKINHMEKETAESLEKLSQLVNHIADNYQEDPRDLKHSLSFVKHYLPRLNTIVDNFENLSGKALTPESQQRLSKIGHNIQGYVPHFQSIYDACLENDFKKLELETDVLGDVMKLNK